MHMKKIHGYFSCKKPPPFCEKNIQNAGVQKEPLRFHMIIFFMCLCVILHKKNNMYICLQDNLKQHHATSRIWQRHGLHI